MMRCWLLDEERIRYMTMEMMVLESSRHLISSNFFRMVRYQNRGVRLLLFESCEIDGSNIFNPTNTITIRSNLILRIITLKIYESIGDNGAAKNNQCVILDEHSDTISYCDIVSICSSKIAPIIFRQLLWFLACFG